MNKKNTHGELKQKLVVAGEEILEAQGLDALSLRATARAVGVSHMAPYRHFEDKESLLAAIAEKGFHDLTKAMEDSTCGKNERDHLQVIKVAYVTFASNHPGLYRLMFSVGTKNKSRFPGLGKATGIALLQCKEAIAARYRYDQVEDAGIITKKALATFALVHGLANLIIDKRVLPSALNSSSEIELISELVRALEPQ